jgi:hypothetical protein
MSSDNLVDINQRATRKMIELATDKSISYLCSLDHPLFTAAHRDAYVGALQSFNRCPTPLGCLPLGVIQGQTDDSLHTLAFYERYDEISFIDRGFNHFDPSVPPVVDRDHLAFLCVANRSMAPQERLMLTKRPVLDVMDVLGKTFAYMEEYSIGNHADISLFVSTTLAEFSQSPAFKIHSFDTDPAHPDSRLITSTLGANEILFGYNYPKLLTRYREFEMRRSAALPSATPT